MSEERKKINVIISGASIPLKLPQSEVQQIHNIVAEINRKVIELQGTYSTKDVRECLAMALLTYAVDLNKMKLGHSSNDNPSSSELNRLDQLLDQYMQTS